MFKPSKETRKENARRVRRAETALTDYLADDGDPRISVRDLLADLRHYCDAHGINFGEEDRMAHYNYLAEINY
jgi:hypothetical protein